MWELLIPLLIFFGIYILQYLFKPPEDKKQQQPGQRRPQGAPPRTNPAKPRRQVSDLDRFLEETRKRKQQEENKPVVIVEPIDEQSLSDTADRERKAAQAKARQAQSQAQRTGPRPERKQRPITVPPPPIDPPRAPLRETAAPVILELAPTPSNAPPPLRGTLPPPPPPPPAPPAFVEPARDRLGHVNMAAALAPSQRNTVTPVLAELMKLIKKPQGVVLAVLLTEILEHPPSCRR